MSERTVAVLPIQRAVATASPSAWSDAMVMCAGDGSVTLAHLDGRVSELLTGAPATVGSPVAFHPVAEVLSVDGAWFPARAVLAA